MGDCGVKQRYDEQLSREVLRADVPARAVHPRAVYPPQGVERHELRFVYLGEASSEIRCTSTGNPIHLRERSRFAEDRSRDRVGVQHIRLTNRACRLPPKGGPARVHFEYQVASLDEELRQTSAEIPRSLDADLPICAQ